MYTNDKIIRCGEILESGKFDNNGGNPFYVFLMPKADDSPASYVASSKLSYEKEYKDIPFTSNSWNPVVFNGIDVSSDMLQKYRVFYGMEDSK